MSIAVEAVAKQRIILQAAKAGFACPDVVATGGIEMFACRKKVVAFLCNLRHGDFVKMQPTISGECWPHGIFLPVWRMVGINGFRTNLELSLP